VGAQQNVQTIEGMYAALGRGDIDAIVDVVTDDVDWATDDTALVAAALTP